MAEQKAELKHGQFTKWIEQNLDFTDRTARTYMKLFRYKDKLKTETISVLKDATEQINQIEWQEKWQKENVEARKEEKEKRFKLIDKFVKTKIKPDGWDSKCLELLRKTVIEEKLYKNKMSYNIISKPKQFDYWDDVCKRRYNKLYIEHKRNENLFLGKDRVSSIFPEEKEEVIREKLRMAGNRLQNDLFNLLNEYLNGLNNNSHKLEALHNIIKYCKRLINSLQQESIKENKPEILDIPV